MQFELQPHFLQLIKSWEFAQKYLMAKHDGVQKGFDQGRITGPWRKLQRSDRKEKKEMKIIPLK